MHHGQPPSTTGAAGDVPCHGGSGVRPEGAGSESAGAGARRQSFRLAVGGAAASFWLPIGKVSAGFTVDVGALAFPHGPHGEWTGTPKTPGLALMQHCAAPSCFYTSRRPQPSTAASYPLRHSLPPLPSISAPSTARQSQLRSAAGSASLIVLWYVAAPFRGCARADAAVALPPLLLCC